MDNAEQDLNSREWTRILVPEDSGDAHAEHSDDEHTARSPSHQTVTFSTLPTELRLIIWNLAQPDPRIVRIQYSNRSPATYSSAAIPNLLHVCQESRQVALEWYQLSFGSGWRGAYNRSTVTSLDGISKEAIIPNVFASPRTYFDFSHDILFTGCEGCDGITVICPHCCWLFLRDDAKKVRKLLIQCGKVDELDERELFQSAADYYPEAEEIMIFSPLTKISESEKQWNLLCESSFPFPWRTSGQTLMERYIAARPGRRYRGWKAERVIRVDFSDPSLATHPCQESH